MNSSIFTQADFEQIASHDPYWFIKTDQSNRTKSTVILKRVPGIWTRFYETKRVVTVAKQVG